MNVYSYRCVLPKGDKFEVGGYRSIDAVLDIARVAFDAGSTCIRVVCLRPDGEEVETDYEEAKAVRDNLKKVKSLRFGN